MSGADSTSQPSDERQSNRARRPLLRKTQRAPFPLLSTAAEEKEIRGAALIRTTDLDVTDPTAGGGRGFQYEWENTARQLEDEIQSVAVGGGISFTHHQTVPAAQWVIDHHMSLIPNVILLDSGGQEMIAEIHHPSDQTTVVVHSAPYTGTAYLRP